MNFLLTSFAISLKDNKRDLFMTLLNKIIQGFIPVVQIIIFQKVINSLQKIIENGNIINFGPLITIIILFFLIKLLDSLTNNIDPYLNTKIEQKIEGNIKDKISKISMDMPYSKFDDNKLYDFLQRLTGDIGNRFFSPINTSFLIVKNSITLITLFIYLFTFFWGLPLLLFLSTFPYFFIKSKLGNKKFHMIRYMTPSGRLHSYLFSLFTNKDSNKEIRLFKSRDFFMKKWKFYFNETNTETLKFMKKEQFAETILELLGTLVLFIGIAISIAIFMLHSLNIGDFVGIVQALQNAQTSALVVTSLFAVLYEQKFFINDYQEFNTYSEYSDKSHKNKKFPEQLNSIEIKNVSFIYPLTQKEVLKNINLKINAGETIALVGENGSGKSSLIQCLLGIYEVSNGEILINEVPLKLISRESLYKNTAVVFQNYGKYNLSILDNIKMGGKSEKETIEIKSKQIDIHNIIMQLTNGYNTVLGREYNDSTDFSGGLWQRLAILRALVRDPELLILDEPTSALDPIAEASLFLDLKSHTENITTIFISHRMYSARFADRIIVMKEGNIVEIGSHDELIKKKEHYYSMYTKQADMFSEKLGAAT